MAFSGSDWAVGSNAFIAISILWLVWLRLSTRYLMQVAMLGVLVLASCYYHVCWTSAGEWCPGPRGHEGEREISMARDIMAAFQAMGVALVPIDQWLLHRYPAWVHTWICLGTFLATWVLVAAFSDGLETCLAVPIFWGLFSMVALVMDRTQPKAMPWSVWRWLRLLLGAGCLAAGAGVRAKALAEYDSGVSSAGQSQDYLLNHGVTHMLFGVGLFLVLTTLHRAPATESHAYAPVGGMQGMAGRIKASARK